MNPAGIILVLSALAAPAAAPETSGNVAVLSKARGLLMGGKYAEAAAIYKSLAATGPAAPLGLARCYAAEGKLSEAREILTRALESLPKPSPIYAPLHSELARLAFERGDYDEAKTQADKAVKLDDGQLPARYVLAELHRVAGRLDEAEQGYAALIRYYNEQDVEDAESLRWIGLAAARYAGWNRLHNQFKFLVNELYPDALKLDPAFWPAHYDAGNLFLEKHNRADAAREIQAGLELNPGAAELHVAKAELAAAARDFEQAASSIDRAIEINPKLLDARLAKADLALANFDVPGSLKLLEETALPLNPLSEETLGRVAACYVLLDGPPKPGQQTRFSKLVKSVTDRNPHAGDFFSTLASALESRNKFLLAKRFFAKAIEVMPREVGPRSSLGLLAMRTAEEDDAKRWLDKAFTIDPFNVRVKNTLEVLDVLDSMKTLETEHAVIKYDGKRDELLARYVAKHIDAIYPEMCGQFGYKPPGKPLLEIFSSAKGHGGHQWFSVRLVGLPYVGTVAACTGCMVAMASPNEMEGPMRFNWARVVKHELVHVITLQQTHFNIPHWYTEGLAVLSEGGPRPPSWNEMLLERVPAGKIFNLGTINFGFIRPKKCDDRQMAYCQAELYVEFMLSRWGPGKQRKLLAAYADGMDTPEAIKHALGITIEEFERRYLAYLGKLVDGMSALKHPSKASLAELSKAHRDQPENAGAAAELAYAYLRRGAKKEAGETAEKAIRLKPKEQLATYVIARLRLEEGKAQEAVELLEGSLDREAPQPNALNLLAGLKLKAEQYDEAARLYALGERLDPINRKWTKALGRAYLLADNQEKLAETLSRLAAFDPDHITVRKKLAEMALKGRDYAAAAKWARQAVEIDVMDAGLHRMLAEALAGEHNYEAAIEELDVAIELDPREPYLRYALADAYIQTNRPAEARKVLEELLELKPDYPGAELMLEEVKDQPKN